MTLPTTPTALDVAARALHDFGMSHHHIHEGRDPLEGGRYSTWEDTTEQTRRSTRWIAQKALESATFDDFYAWLTLTERMTGQVVPDASSDTERTRGARAQYYLIQHLLRIDDAALPMGAVDA